MVPIYVMTSFLSASVSTAPWVRCIGSPCSGPWSVDIKVDVLVVSPRVAFIGSAVINRTLMQQKGRLGGQEVRQSGGLANSESEVPPPLGKPVLARPLRTILNDTNIYVGEAQEECAPGNGGPDPSL
jgi:hypothetical protein